MKIKITDKNIREGTPGKGNFCPVHNALMDTEEFSFVTVGVRNIYFRKKFTEKETHVEIPNFLAEWIYNYDFGKKVSPIEFELDIK